MGVNSEEFTCRICFEPSLIREKRFKNSDICMHPFCTDCMIKFIRSKVEDHNAGHIKCPALNCDHTLDPVACASLIGPSLFLRWCDVLCEAAISGVDKCYCPYRDCNVMILNECGGDLRNSSCPSCKRWFCFRYLIAWHVGSRCEDMGQVRQRDSDDHDLDFQCLVKQMGWRRCPSCRHFIERVGGCRFVKCRCRVTFCYQCGLRGKHSDLCLCDYAKLFWCGLFVGFIAILWTTSRKR